MYGNTRRNPFEIQRNSIERYLNKSFHSDPNHKNGFTFELIQRKLNRLSVWTVRKGNSRVRMNEYVHEIRRTIPLCLFKSNIKNQLELRCSFHCNRMEVYRLGAHVCMSVRNGTPFIDTCAFWGDRQIDFTFVIHIRFSPHVYSISYAKVFYRFVVRSHRWSHLMRKNTKIIIVRFLCE